MKKKIVIPAITAEDSRPASVHLARYRYFCEACTGIGFYSNNREVLNQPSHCQNCGHPIAVIKKENFIKI